MPVSPADAEKLAAAVVEMYQEAERVMIERIAKNLARGLDGPEWAVAKRMQLQAFKRQIQELVEDLRVEATEGIKTALTEAYEKGGLQAVQDIARMTGAPGVEPLVGARAIDALVKETVANVTATHLRILRSAEDAFEGVIAATEQQMRDVIGEEAGRVLTGAITRRDAAQAALNRFAERGIVGFVDKRGRGWNLSSYTEMAMRTACGRAAVQGHVDRLSANGFDLVIVSDAPRECHLCRPWEGKVLSIGGIEALREETPDATPPTLEGQPPNAAAWKPTMTPEEAAAWNRGTAFEGETLYHFTREGSVESIKSEGFRPSTAMYGTGIYLSSVADSSMLGKVSVDSMMKVATRIERPLDVKGLSGLGEYLDAHGYMDVSDPMAALKALGFDGAIIRRRTGDYIIAFSREQVTVLK